MSDKKLGFIGKLIYGNNIVFALLLLVSFVLPFIPPEKYPNISLLSLAVSPLIVINVLFVIYWIIKIKKQVLLSFVILVFAYFHFGSFYKVSSKTTNQEYNNTLKILSYNVRLFNVYEKKDKQIGIPEIIKNFINKEQPEVICIQEYYKKNKVDFSEYPYQYIHFKDENILGHAIFSKYPIINKYSFDFKQTYNNTLSVDIVKGNDTIRVYNLHLQSLSIKASMSYLQEMDKDVLRHRMSARFIKQQKQAEIIINHKSKTKHPVILCGDFNNTPFSYVYKKLSESMNDAFVEAGNGLGTTYLFEKYPMRIDYVLTSKKLKVVDFTTIKKTFSDHYPISTLIGW